MTHHETTADVLDVHPDAKVVDAEFRQYGGRRVFGGRIETVRCFEDNVLVRELLSGPGEGRVLVVDGGGSGRVALLGDQMAEISHRNGWSGVVINGAIRDVAALARIDVGVAALSANPRPSGKAGGGAIGDELTFGGVVFRRGGRIIADEDGVIVLPE